MKKIGLTLLVVLMLLSPVVLLLGVAVAMNPAAKTNCITGGVMVGVVPDQLTVELKDGASVTLDNQQLRHAATIITIASRVEGSDHNAIIIALMAALTESRLRMLANSSAYPESAGYPNDGEGSDHDSLGLFQMRHQTGWGEVADLMDPVYQVRAFIGGPTGPNYPSPRGLLDIPNWETLSKGAAAQAVEVSAYPDRYTNWEPAANTILTTLTAPTTTVSSDSSGVASDILETTKIVFPLPEGTWVLSSPFGYRIHPITGKRKLHAGSDYSAPDGTPIMAVADGMVSYAGPSSGYGNLILISHTINNQPITSGYAHMWDGHLYVKTGDQVSAGQHIADVGSNGRSTGPHLHLEIRPHHDATQVIDPNVWLSQQNATHSKTPNLNADGCYLPQGKH
jgi:murein DD-endopeptidase MepM/ murein hydrolase activator NlpD